MKRLFGFALAGCMLFCAACTRNTTPNAATTTANAVVSLQPTMSPSPTVSATQQQIRIKDNSFVVGAPAIEVAKEPLAYDWQGLQGDMKLMDGGETYDVIYAGGEFLLRNNGQIFDVASGKLAAKIERVTGKDIGQWMAFRRGDDTALTDEQNSSLMELLNTLKPTAFEPNGDNLKTDQTSTLANDYGMSLSLSLDHTRLFASWLTNSCFELGDQKAAFEAILLSKAQ